MYYCGKIVPLTKDSKHNGWQSLDLAGNQRNSILGCFNQPTERQIAKNAVPLPDTDVLQMAGVGGW
jgi:hypothetical protein